MFPILCFPNILRFLNPSKPTGISRSYQLDQSISVLRVDGWYFSFLFKFKSTSGNPDQPPHFAVSDLGLYCLPVSHKKDPRLI